jgi:methylenetetrahydrofolate dehydrogenase (NADP+)/methenyltetrahydrofolate cyclohydrolase
MTAKIISGKELAASIKSELKDEVTELAKVGIRPKLTVILVGDDPASHTYVKGKERASEEVGILSEIIRVDATITEDELLAEIQRINADPAVSGLLVQLPLPKHINEKAIINAIDPIKDVDGFHPINVGKLMIGDEGYLPCTPYGIIELIKSTGLNITGKNAVIIGRSNIVGKPLAILLLRENATVTVAHSRTVDLPSVARRADILISAIGQPEMITKEYVGAGAVVIDVGTNRNAEGKYVGDCDFDSVAEVAGYITPVPGGVGPMTITMLMKNTVEAAKKQSKGE